MSEQRDILDEAMELFKLPKKAGFFEEKDMTIGIGKFGPYIRHNSSFYSLPKDVDPLDVSEAQAIEIILEKRKNAIYQADEKITLRKSHQNPYIQKLYAEFLGKPGSHKAHELLHTHYTPRQDI